MKASVWIGLVILIALIGAGYYFLGQGTDLGDELGNTRNLQYVFQDPIKTPHYVDTVPRHASVLPAVPLNVIASFNFDLGPGSELKIIKDGIDYGQGVLEIDDNKLTMRRAMMADSPEGQYSVQYKACWPDGSCHDGEFGFAIDSSLLVGFMDMRNQTEITITMKDIAFNPKEVIISSGTTVTWTNNDAIDHYINTDPHSGHNYYPYQNSALLKPGDNYTLQFGKPGVYPYHCSLHAATMTGTIVVQ
jgi:plastocyanin